MQVTLGLHRAGLVSGRRPAVLDGALRRTWLETGARVARLGGGLRGIGVERGDRVAVLMLNGHRFLELYYALPWIGALVMPINIRLAPKEILEQLADAEAKLLVVDDAFARMLPALAGQMPSVRVIVHAGDGPPPPGTVSLEELIRNGPAVEDVGASGDELYGLFYTGGTTAASKGVMLSHANIVTNAYNTNAALTIEANDIYLHAAPMFHMADSASTFAITANGGQHAFIPAFDVAKTLEAIQTLRVSFVLLVPTMINAVVHSPQIGGFDLSSLKRIAYGASPMPAALLEKALSSLGCEFIQGYGMTETAPLLTYLPARDHVVSSDEKKQKRLRSAGLPVLNIDLRILDPQGRQLPVGEIGEICVKGANVMKGYWRKPEATAEALRGGFMHTGDLGYLDEDGYVYLVDRAKDMIVSGGENIYCVEVEAALYVHAAVLEAAVFGIPHDEWGEQVHAVVVLKEGQTADPDQLIEHCKSRIASYKCPKTLTLRQEALPKSGAGKILKRDLRAPFWQGQERQIH